MEDGKKEMHSECASTWLGLDHTYSRAVPNGPAREVKVRLVERRPVDLSVVLGMHFSCRHEYCSAVFVG
ncbi:hypothetical protein E2C01_010055 [Portunus trituberculatus]|uniref:Uncharacterized protein n=1 Tax=Portunus trituberculatus TaxID=210409 RepID=A0A5B7D7M2_PORTR|nr:hypothetical protein [Portunus trituberculatus]